MSTRRRGAPSADPSPTRVVLDTNVVLSALVFGKGTTARLRAAWQGSRFLPLVSTATARELVRVLSYPKFRLEAQEQQELLADYLPYAEVVRIPEPPPSVPVCRDPFDLPFLHLAAAGQGGAEFPELPADVPHHRFGALARGGAGRLLHGLHSAGSAQPKR